MSDHEVGYLAQGHWHHFHYRIGEMTGPDRERKEVRVSASHDDEGRLVTPQRGVPYDTLMIAIGSQSKNFGTSGVAQHAMRLESAADAVRFHHRKVTACIRAHAQREPLSPAQLHVAITGAGATGVELAAELHRTTREVVACGLDCVDADKDIQVMGGGSGAARAAGPARAAVQRHQRTADQLGREGADRRQGGSVGTPVRAPGRWPRTPGRTDRLGGRREGARLPERHRRRLDGQPLQACQYRDCGSLVSLGEFSTVGNMIGGLIGGSLMIEGYFAKLTYLSLANAAPTAYARPRTMSSRRPTMRSPPARRPLWAYSLVTQARNPRTLAAVSSAKDRST